MLHISTNTTKEGKGGKKRPVWQKEWSLLFRECHVWLTSTPASTTSHGTPQFGSRPVPSRPVWSSDIAGATRPPVPWDVIVLSVGSWSAKRGSARGGKLRVRPKTKQNEVGKS